MDRIHTLCDQLIDHHDVLQKRKSFLKEYVGGYKQACYLLGFFAQLRNFEDQKIELQQQLASYRISIMNMYIDIIDDALLKVLLKPPNATPAYQKGLEKFLDFKQQLVFYYKSRLSTELSKPSVHINKIRKIVLMVSNLSKYYSIYQEIVLDFQKKDANFNEIMQRHLNEFSITI